MHTASLSIGEDVTQQAIEIEGALNPAKSLPFLLPFLPFWPRDTQLVPFRPRDKRCKCELLVAVALLAASPVVPCRTPMVPQYTPYIPKSRPHVPEPRVLRPALFLAW